MGDLTICSAKNEGHFLERMLPLGKAANLLGIDSRTLRRWLEDERGLALPRLGRGASPLVRVADVQAVIASRQGIQKYTPRPTPPAPAKAGAVV
jgi:hypothetical protein